MNYIKEIKSKSIEDALSLDDTQRAKIRTAIQQAYDQSWHKDGPNVDQINAYVAPFIETPEEAFFAAIAIMSDILGGMLEMAKK